VSRDQTQKLPNPVIDAACAARRPSALPAFAGVDLGSEGYAIVKVEKVVPRDVPVEAAAKQQRDQYAQWWTSAENLAYYNGLKERFKAEILVPKPQPAKENAEETVTQ
jgi:peptidyl-prolyl cis-trans isomerase D